jgi:hypothetical protein
MQKCRRQAKQAGNRPKAAQGSILFNPVKGYPMLKDVFPYRATDWHQAALAAPARRNPPLLGVDAPLRSLKDAARAVAIARTLEAAERARGAQAHYESEVEAWRQNMRDASTL